MAEQKIDTRELAEKLAEALAPMAKENQRQSKGQGKKGSPILADLKVDTREQAAKEAGVSHGSLAAFRFLKDNAEPEELAEKLAEALKPQAKEKQLEGQRSGGRGKKNLSPILAEQKIDTRELAEKLAEALRPKAKEKQAKAGPKSGRGKKRTASANIGESTPIDTREQAAKEAGVSHGSLAAFRFLKDNAEPEELAELKRNPNAQDRPGQAGTAPGVF